MPDAVTHPSARALIAYSQGQLSGAAARTVASHLETCSSCRAAVADSLPGKVRAAKPGSSSLPAAGKTAAWGNAPPPPPPKSPASAGAPLNLPPELANQGKYRILCELGRGGMGVVYQARHTVMDRIVALKVINPSVLAHPDALPRFQGEVRAAARLDHEHIVRAHDADQVGNLHLLVMEFVEGMSLADLVQEKGPLPIPHACHYVRQAALGLQHAFEQGMVHRDVKPQNLMVTARGTVKILDFGLARMRSERGAAGGLTEVGSFMGTADYVAPEQATDARNADTRADVYSLGCTLYCLLTGRPPFVEDTAVKLVLAHLEKEARPLHEVRSDVPRELSAVVARMLAKDPTRRFQTPVAVAQALDPFTKSGAKLTTGSVPPPLPGVGAPGAGTAMGGDTSKFKEPKRTPLSQPPIRKPVEKVAPPPLEWLADVPGSPAQTTRGLASPPPPKPWHQRGAVWTGLGVVLLALGVGGWFLAAGLLKDKGKPADKEAKASPNEGQPAPIDSALAALVKPPDQKSDTVPTGGPPITGGGDVQKEPPETAGKGTQTEQPSASNVPVRPMPTPNPTEPPPPDPIRDKLDQAKAEFKAEMDKYGKTLLEAMDKAEDQAGKVGNKKLVNQLGEERATFQKEGKVPKAAVVASEVKQYLRQKIAARSALLDAFKAAARDYNRAKLDQKAEAVENERKRFALDWPLDVFQPGTIWKGTTEWGVVGINQRGVIPSTLTVLDRDEGTFKARFEDGSAIREVSGTIKGNQVGWLAKNVKEIQGGQGSDHSGKFDSTNLVFETSWIRPVDKRLVVAKTTLQLQK